MAVALTGLVVLLIYLAASHAHENVFSYSQAEPVHQIGGNTTISFPFARDAWSNSAFPCPEYHFACNSSGKCLDMDRRCDGFVDCPKAEDELNCVCAFRIPPGKFCDKYPDCFDQSDENFCSYCPEGSFNCENGKCIPRDKVCDSVVDCDNFMDENFCFRLSSDFRIADADPKDPEALPNTSRFFKSGFLLRNKKGVWYPVCANPHDNMKDSLASFACVSITANPLAESTSQYRKFKPKQGFHPSSYIYHYRGRFVQWNGCITDSGLFVSCNDVRCGFNPKQLIPSRPKGRIVGGETSEPGAWPWHAAIYRNGTYSCGATLISYNWLLSAAHCFLNHKIGFFEIQLGMLRRRSFTPHQKTYRIDRIVPHEKFNIITLDYDIVMMRTSEPVIFDFWVRPICLPDPRVFDIAGSFCTAIGWGDTGETEDDSDSLLEVNVPITNTCKKSMDRWICAGFVEGGRDACQGDSGGPLMCLQKDGISWYIAGVISAGAGCARPDTPGMYTKVSYFLDWIKDVMVGRIQADRPLTTCPGWKCDAVGGGHCLRAEKVCDGHVDCYDAQDEANCL
ncbi:serine protease nudel-like [Uloborus diversus]|uniref:serine protease nudel-like n=1 Tax=Uloborus diversus TaxID=327109 RepID=UPI0024090AFD|nr:serine protease nudel-like [Uloborus diversus]